MREREREKIQQTIEFSYAKQIKGYVPMRTASTENPQFTLHVYYKFYF